MKKGAASDYIQAKKQNAIYTDMHINAQLTGTTVNPVKKNGFYYNNNLNILVPRNCTKTVCAGGVLTNAHSYQLRVDFKQGKYYNNYVCICTKEPVDSVNEDCDVTQVNGKKTATCLCSPCAFNN